MEIRFSFFATDILFRLKQCGSRMSQNAQGRELVFLKILIASDDGIAFSSPERFAAVSGCPLPTCKQVWDFCTDAGILKKDEFGCYNANDWIAEHSELFRTDNATKTRPKRVQNPKASNSSTEPKTSQITPSKPQQSASNADQAFYTDKIAVRPNVWLSHAEIADLKKKYSDDDISRMVDYYSDWKLKKGSNVRTSDYQSITRWVYKILTEKPKEPVKDANPFPAWIYGKTE
jgi:hypothetical protein